MCGYVTVCERELRGKGAVTVRGNESLLRLLLPPNVYIYTNYYYYFYCLRIVFGNTIVAVVWNLLYDGFLFVFFWPKSEQ